MSNQNTKTVSAALFATLCEVNEKAHHAVKQAMTEVGQKLTFPEDFGKCTNEDYKNIHQALRVLISAKRKEMWEDEVKEIRNGIAEAVETYMVSKRVEKSEYDATPAQYKKFLAPFPTSFSIPFSLLKAAFPKGTTDQQMVVRCKELSHTVVKSGEEYAIKVAFIPEAPKSEESAESAAA